MSKAMLNSAIALLDGYVPDPSLGLPDVLFEYISRTTPLINVDLLIKDKDARTLLSWRDDKYAGKGWHIPGGIVRYKETLETRINKVAETEIGTSIAYDASPLEINQIINTQSSTRGHFISLLYRCFLINHFIPENKGLSPDENGYLMWHERCPDNLIKSHNIYRKYIL